MDIKLIGSDLTGKKKLFSHTDSAVVDAKKVKNKVAIKLVFHVSPIFKKMRGSGGGAYSKGRLFDIMVLGVGAYLGKGANKSISNYSRK